MQEKENGNRVKCMKYLSYSAVHKIDYNLRSKEMQGWKMNTLLHNTIIQSRASGGGICMKHEKLYLCCVSWKGLLRSLPRLLKRKNKNQNPNPKKHVSQRKTRENVGDIFHNIWSRGNCLAGCLFRNKSFFNKIEYQSVPLKNIYIYISQYTWILGEKLC